MNKYIAYCGLDCAKCEARIATINNDDKLREEVSEKWSRLNKVEITPEMINCEGCKLKGARTIYCDSLCPIRKCAIDKHYDNCGQCNEFKTCEKIKMIIKNNKETYKRLIGDNK